MKTQIKILFTLAIIFSFFLSPALAEEANTVTKIEENAISQNIQEKARTQEIAKNTSIGIQENTTKELEPPHSFSWGNYFQAIGTMLLLLFLFWYILRIIKKVGNGRFLPNQKLLPKDSLYLEGQLHLGQGKSIVIIQALGERLILGVTEKQINLLTKTGICHEETFDEILQKTTTQDNSNS